MRPTNRTESGLRRRAAAIRDVVAVVCCIAILAVVLAPVMAGVARSSKDLRCLSNLAQIGAANVIYSSLDPDDMALPVHPLFPRQCPSTPPGQLCTTPTFVGAYEWGGKSGIGRDDFLAGTGGDPLNSKYGTKAGFGPASRPMNPILYPDRFHDYLNPQFDPVGALGDTQLELDVYRCPADTGYAGIHCPDFSQSEYSAFDHFGTSYHANVFMSAPGGGGEMRSSSPFLHRMVEIRDPKRTLAYQEVNGRFAWTAAPEQEECTETLGLTGNPGAVRGWHGKDWTFHAAFIDGHADAIYMRGYRPEEPAGWSFAQIRCVVIRGEGWQIDAFPASAALSGVYHNGDGRPSYEGCFSGQ